MRTVILAVELMLRFHTEKGDPMPEDTGERPLKPAKRIRKGLQRAAGAVFAPLGLTEMLMAANATKCYPIVPLSAGHGPSNSDDDYDSWLNGETWSAVRTLFEAGYDARVFIAGGTVFGYIFLKEAQHETTAKVLKESYGIALSEEPVDWFTARLVRRY